MLDTLSYASIFQAGLTFDELSTRLHTSKRWPDDDIRQAVDRLIESGQIHKRGKWLVLPSLAVSRSHLQERSRASLEKTRIAIERMRVFSWFPTIEAIALTGSVAAGSALPDDDIDLMIITRPGMLWITRLAVLALLLPTGWLRRSQEHGQFNNLLCLNLWLTTEALSMQQQTLYIAHEVMQATFLEDRNQIEQRLLRANAWVERFLGNGYAKRVSSRDPVLASRNELFTRASVMFLWCNAIAFALQHWHMRGKQSREVVTREKAFFHPRDTNKEIMRSYAKKRMR